MAGDAATVDRSVVLAVLGVFSACCLVGRAATVHLPSPGDIPRLASVALRWHSLGFTLGLSLLTGVLFGLAGVAILAPT